MGEIISTRTHLLDGQIKHQKVVVIKPNYFMQELGLIPCSEQKVTKGIDSNYFDVIKAGDFSKEPIPLSHCDSKLSIRSSRTLNTMSVRPYSHLPIC